jgi:hypothetical protein
LQTTQTSATFVFGIASKSAFLPNLWLLRVNRILACGCEVVHI